ncbi:cysteine proteinase [Lepidopterella palustris CBS 459.81]|uniref:Cysteine proteinase n=1 Tax=Lepidopterella palustris CBS 459.81 TaxID=1314670 RepID=A0A8E2JFB0_9PEZI|nr:cysteine proteinase [Lepidopterella palustris CBS 459.81]
MSSGFHPFKGKVSRHFGDNLAPDDTYLIYHDVRLTKLDMDSIRNDWFTDNAIAFWEEYLEHERLKAYPQANISLLRPSMSFMLMSTPNPLTLKDVLPNFSATTHIFLPINDCQNVEQVEGGSHWSLLLVSILDGVAFHYDSMSPSNDTHARKVAKNMGQLLGKPLQFINMDDAPQQENGSDCGVFVCLIMQHLLLRRLLKVDAKEKVSMSMAGRGVNATHGRKQMLKIIDGFRKEGERRRSTSPSHKDHSKSKSPPRIGDENETANVKT